MPLRPFGVDGKIVTEQRIVGKNLESDGGGEREKRETAVGARVGRGRKKRVQCDSYEADMNTSEWDSVICLYTIWTAATISFTLQSFSAIKPRQNLTHTEAAAGHHAV